MRSSQSTVNTITVLGGRHAHRGIQGHRGGDTGTPRWDTDTKARTGPQTHTETRTRRHAHGHTRMRHTCTATVERGRHPLTSRERHPLSKGPCDKQRTDDREHELVRREQQLRDRRCVVTALPTRHCAHRSHRLHVRALGTASGARHQVRRDGEGTGHRSHTVALAAPQVGTHR
jgi:hypothetical protein